MSANVDPWLRHEDVLGERALTWVREGNAETEAPLEARPGLDRVRRAILEGLESRAQSPAVERRGDA